MTSYNTSLREAGKEAQRIQKEDNVLTALVLSLQREESDRATIDTFIQSVITERLPFTTI